jgi:hypothetical protein
MKVFSNFAILVLVAGLAMTASPAGIQHPEAPFPGVEGLPAITGPTSPDAFGGNQQYTVFHASRFMPWDGSSNPIYHTYGYIRPGAEGEGYWAQADLPAGAEIIAVMWHVYDDTATGRFLVLQLARYQAARGGTLPDEQSIQDQNTGLGDTPGYQLLNSTDGLPVTVRSYEDIDGVGGSDYTAYTLNVVTEGTPLIDLRLFGATVVWNRIISPAPGSATFPDVDPSFWAFQEIEALAASGITTGFPDGTFRPTAAVTRAQMATFLARALGLHWPQ